MGARRKGAGFERAWSAGAELGVRLWNHVWRRAKGQHFLRGSRRSGARDAVSRGGARKKRLTFRVLFRCLVASLLRVPRDGRCGLPSFCLANMVDAGMDKLAVSVEDVCW